MIARPMLYKTCFYHCFDLCFAISPFSNNLFYICLISTSQIVSLFLPRTYVFSFSIDVVLILSIRGLLLRDWSPMLTMWFSYTTHLAILCTHHCQYTCHKLSSHHKIIGACGTVELVGVREAASSVIWGTRKIVLCFILPCQWKPGLAFVRALREFLIGGNVSQNHPFSCYQCQAHSSRPKREFPAE